MGRVSPRVLLDGADIGRALTISGTETFREKPFCGAAL
jgi:hypothetical protein